MSPVVVPTVERLTDYALRDTPTARQERDVEQTLHASLASVVSHEYSFEGVTTTLTDVALGTIGQLGALELDSSSKVLILGTATSGIPYAPALKHIIDASMVDAPKIETGYLLAKRNVTHLDDNLGQKQDSEIEKYVAEKGHDAIQQDEIDRLRKAYGEGDQLPNAVVLLDETEWSGKTLDIGREMLTAAFGKSLPVITLSNKADLPWQYDGKARLTVEQDAEGQRLVVSDVDSQTKNVFRIIAGESVRYIQEAVRGNHPEVVEAYPNIDFDLAGDKKRAALLAENDEESMYIRLQIAKLANKSEVFQPMKEALQRDLDKQPEVLTKELAMHGLVKGSRLLR